MAILLTPGGGPGSFSPLCGQGVKGNEMRRVVDS